MVKTNICSVLLQSSISMFNFQLNGVNTQGENIADNGGIKEAYYAYEQWTQRHGEEKKLPGLKYTPRQVMHMQWKQSLFDIKMHS